MRLDKNLLASAAMLSLMWFYPTSAKADYKPNFNTGRLPKEISASNANGLSPVLECYAAGYTTGGWTVDRVGLKGYCAVSPTHTRSDEACENIMALPELDIEDGMWLRWDALSVHPDFPESYRVEAVAEEGNPVTLLDVDAEEGVWTTHIIPLSEYAGRRLGIRFVCTSTNRFMLAISKLSIGVPSTPEFVTIDSTARYAGIIDSDAALVKVTATNVGATADFPYVECGNGEDSSLYGSYPLSSEWLTGETRTFAFEIPLGENGGKHTYTVVALAAQGSDRVTLCEGTVYASWYTRTLLADKGTGMWCQNCPKGILEMEKLEREFGDAVIGVDTHSYPDLDPLANPSYWDGLGFVAAPYFMLDRLKGSVGGSADGFSRYYDRPTAFKITIDEIRPEGDDAIRVTAGVTTAVDTDNSTDRYRIGYVLTADFYQPDERKFAQHNDVSTPSGDRFYFLPTRIPADLMKYHDVSLTSANAFSGFEKSLPSKLEQGVEYSFSWNVARPELLDDIADGRVVAYLIDTESGAIENTAARSPGQETSVPSLTVNDAALPVVDVIAGGSLRVTLPDAGGYTLDVFDISGCLRLSVSGVANPQDCVAASLCNGFYLVRVTASCGSAIYKIAV